MKSSGSILFATGNTLVCEVRLDDADDLMAHWGLFPPAPDYASWTDEQALDLVRDMASDQRQTPRDSYRMIVRHAVDLSFMGYVNAWKIEPHHFTPQLGIALNPEWQGKAYGAEIYRGLIRFAFEKFSSEDVLHADLDPANTPSLKMHFACGMQPFCFVKDAYINESAVEDELSMRISRRHFERYGANKVILSL